MIQAIIDFFNLPFFVIIGGISTLLVIIGTLFTFYLGIKGVLPVLYRLGMGLAKRKTAIFAESEYSSLSSLLKDSKITSETVQINKTDIHKAESYSIYLVHWKAFSDVLNTILGIKKDSTLLIIYAPPEEGRIDPDSMNEINRHRNTIVVNFRGRLINDIFVSLMTTGYKNE